MLEIPMVTHKRLQGNIVLPASKSLSNRYLIIRAIEGSDTQIKNLSASHDTMILQQALEAENDERNFEDAGTPLRLYLAYACLKDLRVSIDGFPGLRKRPLAPLLKALEQLGAEFGYLQEPYSLPLVIKKGIDISRNEVVIDAGMSSQFLSALLLIAPAFDRGLTIISSGRISSEPYIDLTMDAMRKAGVEVREGNGTYSVQPGPYVLADSPEIESDWSAATFIYAMAAVSDEVNLLIDNLDMRSLQGDALTAKIFESFGVSSSIEGRGIRLSKTGDAVKEFEVDVTHIPDMFPALCAVCAALRIPAGFTGIKNLRLKESDRVNAMQVNLEQVAVHLQHEGDDKVLLEYGVVPDIRQYRFKSFGDHRIAMACSIFAFSKDTVIDDEEVVRKSFPGYWDLFFEFTQNT